MSSSGKLTVSEGLVAFGASESDGPSVVADVPAVSGAAAVAEKNAPVTAEIASENESSSEGGDQGHANAFASTADVGGEGVPVAAGQSSKASSTGNSPSSPRVEMAKASLGGVDNTVTVSAQNSVSAGSSSTSALTAVGNISSSTVNAVGSISITVKFE